MNVKPSVHSMYVILSIPAGEFMLIINRLIETAFEARLSPAIARRQGGPCGALPAGAMSLLHSAAGGDGARTGGVRGQMSMSSQTNVDRKVARGFGDGGEPAPSREMRRGVGEETGWKR